MISIRPLRTLSAAPALIAATFCSLPASGGDLFVGGHVKYQFTHTRYDDDSVFAAVGAERSTDHSLDVRFIASKQWSQWDAEIHYQLLGLHGDSLVASRQLPASPLLIDLGQISDRRRLFDLTSVIEENDDSVLIHRLDRASIGYTSDQFVVRAGRHIVSWGNGLLYNPFDIFNPFDPTSIDKDYKTGDDMLYTQWLTRGSDDLQAILVPRRDVDSGDVEADQSSLAFKFHAVRGRRDVDLLAAEHFGDTVLGAGFAVDWRGAVVRGDLTGTWSDGEFTPSGVMSINYAWTWMTRNVTGFVEYYYNGFGQPDGNYEPDQLAQNTALLERIARGEVFALGRNYLAASATIESTPLLLVFPTVFINLDDGSALLQLIVNYDFKQDFSLLAGFNLPVGPVNTEFGGIPTETEDVFLAPGNAVFAKLGYFY